MGQDTLCLQSLSVAHIFTRGAAHSPPGHQPWYFLSPKTMIASLFPGGRGLQHRVRSCTSPAPGSPGAFSAPGNLLDTGTEHLCALIRCPLLSRRRQLQEVLAKEPPGLKHRRGLHDSAQKLTKRERPKAAVGRGVILLPCSPSQDP